MLVTVNNGLKFEIEIIHDLSCHSIYVYICVCVYFCAPKIIFWCTQARSLHWHVEAQALSSSCMFNVKFLFLHTSARDNVL